MSKDTWLEGRLGYNPRTQRYGLLQSDLWTYDGFHCGEPLQVWDGGAWVQTRMEMASGGVWYLHGTNYRGRDLEGLRIRVDGTKITLIM